MDSVVDVIDLIDENAWASELFTKSPAENVVSMFTPRGVYILASIERKLWNNIVAYQKILSVMCKGSVPLRPGEKIRKFENQNFVHCLVSMCSSMF